MAATRILSIEDEQTVRRSIVAYLEDSGFEVLQAENGRIGLEQVEKEQPDLVLCDIRMPELDGLEVLEAVVKRWPELPVIIVSGTGDLRDAVHALKLGAWDYILKPIHDMAVLEHAIARALERRRLIRENREYRENLEQMNVRLQASLQQIEDDEITARQLQDQLLPPREWLYHDFDVRRYLKTTSLLSGDFVDYFAIDPKKTAFYIADVSGHGVSSALVTVLLKSTISHLLDEYRQGKTTMVAEPDKVLKYINDQVVSQKFGKYLTMFYAVYDEESGRLCYSNGGQYPYPILTVGHESRMLKDKNLPVGLFPAAEFHLTSIELAEPFALTMFSDGVFDILPTQQLRDKNQYLISMMNKDGMSLQHVVGELKIEELETLQDDLTILVVKKDA